MLTYQALITMILGMENLFRVYQEELHKLFLEVSTGERMIPDTVESPVLVSFLASLERKCTALSEQSLTAKLWVQYLRQVGILHLFIELKGLVIGNFIYSVCGQCCCTCMLLDTFTTQNQLTYMSSRWRNSHLKYHHMSTTNINQRVSSLCGGRTRSGEECGGLTRGRRITESALAYFIAAFPVCLKVYNSLEELSGIKAGSSEQHVELRNFHRTRDAHDVAVLLSWLKEHSPWDVDCLRSLAYGVVGDDTINCDQAEYVGLGATKCMIGSKFEMARSILIRDDVVEVNSHQLFVWLICAMKTENDLKHYLSYDLSARPPALFDEVSMHKTVKSTFLQLFSYTTPEKNSTNDPRRIVINGVHLLHALVWPCPATYGQLVGAYLEFVQKHCRVSVTFVFDGYNVQSTKSQHHF
ncbi:hypothetical protein PR048_020088 [Dryococelus australis]|uniref:Uncharacterized protein n=1 Tax=Dryococelus australis TaxID=614101 RepID=A0ABQ9H5A9_9NEOP|nr:hypothetical protein PR048_020088 [Dryococelus australis]